MHTSFVRAVSSFSRSPRLTAKLCGSMLQVLNTTPRAFSVSQGPMLDSWSKSVRMISSPACSWLAMAMARNRSMTLVDGPSTISSGRAALSRRAILPRASLSRAVACCETA